MGSLKELLRVIKYTLDTKYYGLKMEVDIRIKLEYGFEVVVCSDSDWAGDAETRKSISGYVIFLMGCPIFWKSRQQNVVGLSSSEAELYACIDAVKEVKFMRDLPKLSY